MTERLELELAVFNAADCLDHDVHQLLELLPDYSGDFVVWIVDHGSQDETEEVAHELVRRYPQVRFRRGGARQTDWSGHRRRIVLRGATPVSERLGRWLSHLFGPTILTKTQSSRAIQTRCLPGAEWPERPAPRRLHASGLAGPHAPRQTVLRRRRGKP